MIGYQNPLSIFDELEYADFGPLSATTWVPPCGAGEPQGASEEESWYE